MTSEQPKVDREGIQRWVMLIGGLGLALAYSLLQLTVAEFPYQQNDPIVYPVLLVTRNWLFNLGASTGALAIVLLGIARARIRAIWLGFLVGLISALSFGMTIVTCGYTMLTPGFLHIDTTRLGQNIYHLGLSHGAEPGFDYNLYVYIVYKCDSSGLICTNIHSPHRESNVTARIPVHAVSFFQQSGDDALYVRLDDELYTVPVMIRRD